MTRTDPNEVWRFDDFVPGESLGTIDLVIDDDRRTQWETLYGKSDADAPVPQGIYVALMMDAYIKAIQPRPPGNVHAMQTLTFSGEDSRFGDLLQLEFVMGAKEMKRDRRWVNFEVTVRAQSIEIMSGTIRSIWAA